MFFFIELWGGRHWQISPCTDLVKAIIIFRFVELEFYKGFISIRNQLGFVFVLFQKYSILSHYMPKNEGL